MSVNIDIQGLRNRIAAEHRRLGEIAGDVLSAIEVGDRRLVNRLMGELAVALVQHMDEEERDSFHGLVQDRSRDARLVIEEHRHIRHRLARLRCDAEHERLRLSVANAFIDEFRAHAAHEEAIFYRWSNGWRDGGASPSNHRDGSRATTRPPRPDG